MAGLATRGMDAEAFVALYERYEGRFYNVGYRTLGYQDGAARATREAFLGMLRGAEAWAAVHAACHELIEGPAVLPEARTKGIRVANLTLSVSQREALALRELEGLSFGEIAEVMHTDAGAAAELICGAWIRLRDSLCRPGPSTFRRADCERALPLIALEQDGELDPDSNEAGWLDEHLMRCRACRGGRDAMQEATETYRAWRQMAPGPTLFRETMASAAEVVGADWSRAIARHEAHRAAVRSHRLRDLAAIGVLACLLGLVLLAGVGLEDRDGSGTPAAEAPTAGDASPERPVGDERASGGRASERGTTLGSASPRSASPRSTSRRPGSPRSASRRAAAAGPAPPDAPRPRGKGPRPERRRTERERRPAAAPEPRPERPESRPQAQIEREPDPGGQESIAPELTPAPPQP